MAEVKTGVSSSKEFSRVIISLENVLVPADKLCPSPSMIDGLDKEIEMDLRILGCELIQTSGILLRLPQVAMATGQVLFQRFYYSKSFVKHNMEVVAMACVNLASKIEECPRRVRDVINTFYHIKQVRNGKNIHPLILDQNYINIKNSVIKAERRVLKELGFCVHVRHPHKMIVMYLQVLECEKKEKLVQCAWNYMNDSFRTDVFVRYHPETIACACIYLAARQLQIALPNNPQWFSLFMVGEDEIKDIVLTVLKLYARKKPNYDKLEAKVSEMRKLQQEAKIKAKEGNAEFGTPNSTSRHNSPKNISPNPTTLASIKRLKVEEDGRSGSDKGHHYSSKRRDDGKYSNSDRSAYSRSSGSRSSRSISRSPVPKRRRKSPSRKYKGSYKDNYIQHSPVRYIKEKHSHKRKKRARSESRGRSFSPSPQRFKTSHKKHYREKEKYAYISGKDKYFYSSPDKHSRKHRNGHHSPSRYEKHEKYKR